MFHPGLTESCKNEKKLSASFHVVWLYWRWSSTHETWIRKNLKNIKKNKNQWIYFVSAKLEVECIDKMKTKYIFIQLPINVLSLPVLLDDVSVFSVRSHFLDFKRYFWKQRNFESEKPWVHDMMLIITWLSQLYHDKSNVIFLLYSKNAFSLIFTFVQIPFSYVYSSLFQLNKRIKRMCLIYK